MRQLQYQQRFDVPWFEEPSSLDAELLFDNGVVLEDLRDGQVFDHTDEWLHPDAVSAMPDYFEFDGLDFLEPKPIIDLGEVAPSELYTLLPYQNNLYSKQFNFGKPYTPGRFGIRGQYICGNKPTSALYLLVENTVAYVPILIPYNMRLKELGCYVETRDDSKQAILGLYSSQRGEIKDLIESGIINLNTTAYAAFEVDIWLTEGVYFLAMLSNSSTGVVKAGYDEGSLMSLAFKHPNDLANDNVYYQMYTQSDIPFDEGLPEGILMEDLTLSLEQAPTLIAKLG